MGITLTPVLPKSKRKNQRESETKRAKPKFDVEEPVKRIYDAMLFEELKIRDISDSQEFYERLKSIIEERLEKIEKHRRRLFRLED